MRILNLIFTRDFNQWINQFVREQYVFEFPKLWGRSLEDQIIIYDGRCSKWMRYKNDMANLKAYMSKKSLDHYIFSEVAHKKFRQSIHRIRKLLVISPKKIQDPLTHVRLIHTVPCQRVFFIRVRSIFAGTMAGRIFKTA